MLNVFTHKLNLVIQKINAYFSNRTTRFTIISRTIMATVLGIVLSTCLVQPLSMSTSAMFSAPEKRDFEMSDLFAQIADNRPIRKYDDRIVILNIGHNSREAIAEGLSILSLCGPKAVGIDVNFAEPKENDNFLVDAINSLPNVVMPIGLSATQKAGLFQIEDKPFFFDFLDNIKYGVINLPSKSQNGTVRDYAIEFPTEIGTLPSFVTALAEIANPAVVNQLKMKGVDTGTTSYHSREYQTVELEDIEAHAEDFQDKIVLVGAVDDASDLHFTPVKSNVSGIMLHAAALSTVLDGIWFDKLPKKYDYILAITLCFLIMLIVYGYKSNYKGIVLRIFQAFLAYTAVRIGYSLYVDHNVIFDISLTVTLVAFGLFAVDIWNCFEAIWKSLSNKIEKLDSKLNTRQQLC